MKKSISLALLLIAAFSLGLSMGINHHIDKKMKRVTGIGGIFFKAKDPKSTTEWYSKHLGLDTNPYGATFDWYQSPDSESKAQTQWTPFPESSDYFGNNDQDYMINYRVENLESLVQTLKSEGVEIVDEIETFDYGKFVHVLDNEGNRIQLWEPTK